MSLLMCADAIVADEGRGGPVRAGKNGAQGRKGEAIVADGLFNRSYPKDAGAPRGERRLPRDQFQNRAGSADISR